MECYSVIKKLHYEICGQMDGSRKIILSDVTQRQKDKYGMYLLIREYQPLITDYHSKIGRPRDFR